MELHILSQSYSEWQWRDPITKEIITPDNSIHPATHHLFHGDIVDATSTIQKLSEVRTTKSIPCVLDYKSSTHGRMKDKLLYRCIPDNKTIPQFVVPYQPKNIGFEKYKVNKYVLIQFKEWLPGEKHPIGTLVNTIGDVDDIAAFTDYQLYCKSLVYSLNSFNKHSAFLKTASLSMSTLFPNIENRTHLHVFSIDPEGCTDIDDAIGIQTQTQTQTQTIISIYIANVPLIIDYFQLWQHFTERCSTIYLPHNKIPMLPPILSDNICSLLQGEERVAFAMDIRIGATITISFSPVLIKVSRSYSYEEPELLKNQDYQRILLQAKQLNDKLCYSNPINDSHDVVAYFMIFMNYECAKALQQRKCGIFRSAHTTEDTTAHTTEHTTEHIIPTNISKLITNWKYSSGQYCDIDTLEPHKLIGGGLEVYTHITSPIRRIVDVINMSLLQLNTENAMEFCRKWLNKINFINTSMKAIKKVQNNCMLLSKYCLGQNVKLPRTALQGYLFDREPNTNNYNVYKYNVYLPEYNMFTTYKTSEQIDNYTSRMFTLHMFMDEASLKQKLRLSNSACGPD